MDLSTVRTVLDKSKLDDNDALMDVTAIITVLLQIYKETEKQQDREAEIKQFSWETERERRVRSREPVVAKVPKDSKDKRACPRSARWEVRWAQGTLQALDPWFHTSLIVGSEG